MDKPVLKEDLSFTLTWKNAKTNPPSDCGSFWAIIDESDGNGIEIVRTLAICSYYKSWDSWDYREWRGWEYRGKEVNVIWWTETPPLPSFLLTNG